MFAEPVYHPAAGQMKMMQAKKQVSYKDVILPITK
jgi:hypothetical protein